MEQTNILGQMHKFVCPAKIVRLLLRMKNSKDCLARAGTTHFVPTSYSGGIPLAVFVVLQDIRTSILRTQRHLFLLYAQVIHITPGQMNMSRQLTTSIDTKLMMNN